MTWVGGAIFAHNVLSHGDDMQDFLEAIENHPDLETWIERRSRAGISVSVKEAQRNSGRVKCSVRFCRYVPQLLLLFL